MADLIAPALLTFAKRKRAGTAAARGKRKSTRGREKEIRAILGMHIIRLLPHLAIHSGKNFMATIREEKFFSNYAREGDRKW